ncbi:MAG: sialate O-acetylesterase [Planctomycetota bacterium]
MSRIRIQIYAFILIFVFANPGVSTAQDFPFKLAGIFGDHMVLQRDRPIPIWGWGKVGSKVSLKLGTTETATTVDSDGKWLAELTAMPAGGPYELTVTQLGQSLNRSDILIGEVWLCSGQSNMAMTVSRCQDFDNEKSLANIPSIRMMTVAKNASPDIELDCKGAWEIASPDTVGSFSGTAWFFGRKLHEELDVPIGLINSSWGGTDVAAWTSLKVQKSNPNLNAKFEAYESTVKNYDEEKSNQRFEKSLADWLQKKKNNEKVGRRPRKPINPLVNQNRPSNLFNGMIHPLIPYGIRGAIWYQGERNSKTIASGELYEVQLKTMIQDWRSRWQIGDFPFLAVQLPNFKKPQQAATENSGWVMLRESQMNTLELPNTGLAVTTDVGMANDIHPKNKQAVGNRLALWALGTTYEKSIVFSGPLYSSVQFSQNHQSIGKCQVKFKHIGKGLKTSDGQPIRGFAVAGNDKIFHSAQADLGPQGKTMIITSGQVLEPAAVRYNWKNNPDGNLVNSADLPAAPFRTDDWKIED